MLKDKELKHCEYRDKLNIPAGEKRKPGMAVDIDRLTAYAVLLRIETAGAYSNVVLNSKIAKLDPGQISFVRELVYGVVKNKFYLDYIISQLVKEDASILGPKVLVTLRLGLYQLIFMNSVPDYAAVNETVGIAKGKMGKEAGIINRLLRTFIRKRNELSFPENIRKRGKRLVNMYSVDASVVELWKEQFGYDKAEEILKNSNLTPPLTLRVNEMKISKHELKKTLESQGFAVDEPGGDLPVLNVKGRNVLDTYEYGRGFFSVQDAASVIAVKALCPSENDNIVDVCAAPGGKSFCAAEMMCGTGKIFAFDFYSKKVLNMEKECGRLGLKNVETAQRDAVCPDSGLFGRMDKVICDVPCTGLGVFRRKPEIKYKPVVGSGRELAQKQYEILEKSSLYLRNGGKIMYSTCTINEIENRDVVRKFLRNNGNFTLDEEVQLLPHFDHDGFFYCILTKHFV